LRGDHGRRRDASRAVRGRATGWIAACTKGGGLIAQLLSLSALVPGLFTATLAILVPVATALALVWRFGVETRGRDLRNFESTGTSVQYGIGVCERARMPTRIERAFPHVM
jgi:hypothetical protein